MIGDPSTKRPRVLVVEDEQVVAMDLEGSLRHLGYEVVGIASTGTEALQLADETRPDIVLMDIRLPGDRDGVAVAEEVRRRWQLPVVFLTANANNETLTRARAAGPYGYLLKPFRPQELNATILLALSQHHAARELFAEHT